MLPRRHKPLGIGAASLTSKVQRSTAGEITMGLVSETASRLDEDPNGAATELDREVYYSRAPRVTPHKLLDTISRSLSASYPTLRNKTIITRA